MSLKRPIVNYNGHQKEIQIGDTIDNSILTGVTTLLYEIPFIQSFDFIDLYTYTYFAGMNFKINNILSNQTQTIEILVGGSPYTLGDPIIQFDEIIISIDEVSPVNDQVVLECSSEYDLIMAIPEYDSMINATTALGVGKLFKYSEANLDGATYSSVHITV